MIYMIEKGVRIINLGFDLGWSGCWGFRGFCFKVIEFFYFVLLLIEVI